MTRICVCVCVCYVWPAKNGLSDASDVSVSLYDRQATNRTNKAHQA